MQTVFCFTQILLQKKRLRKDKNKKGNFRILQKQTNILGKNYVIQIESSMIEKEDLIKTILFIQLGLFLFLLLGAVGINYFINKNVLKPFYGSLTFLQQFNLESTIEEPLEMPKIVEFKQLNQSIQQLTTSVRKAYFSQKEFIENASHELQTPLTTLKFKLELLLQEQNLSQNQSLLISDMYKVIEYMDELNKNLLLLSKIENGQFASTEAVNITDVVNEVEEDLSLIIESKSQSIRKTFSAENIFLNSNKMLLKILVNNLVLNALQYSEVNAIIYISADNNMLKVCNPGKPINLSTDKIFSRFNKKFFGKGSGLGLSIVKTISELYNYKVSYEYSSGNHIFKLLWNN